MRADTDPDAFLPEVYQLSDEPSHLGDVVSTERLITIKHSVLGKHIEYSKQA